MLNMPVHRARTERLIFTFCSYKHGAPPEQDS